MTRVAGILGSALALSLYLQCGLAAARYFIAGLSRDLDRRPPTEHPLPAVCLGIAVCIALGPLMLLAIFLCGDHREPLT